MIELTVSELSLAIKRKLETSFDSVRVRGEIAQKKLYSSGNLYFSLKDKDGSIIQAICWGRTLQDLKEIPDEGAEVICTGRVTTYGARSQYQLTVESIELAGQGALLKMLEERKKKLAAEGLFDDARKKPLPFLPQVIGVVTSPDGAVISDIWHQLNQRFPRRVLLWPVAVQGATAAAQVAEAIAGFNAMPMGGAIPRPDVLIVARGGGSLEDLMPFNEEIVVRAATASAIPLISAIGHQTDYTLLDFAADKRASTPTDAAKIAVPVRTELLAKVMDSGRKLLLSVHHLVDNRHNALRGASLGLVDLRSVIDNRAQMLDSYGKRLGFAGTVYLRNRLGTVTTTAGKLRHPREYIASNTLKLRNVSERLKLSFNNALKDYSRKLGEHGKLLESVSYKNVLARGYSVIKDNKGRVVSSVNSLKHGQSITLTLHDGETSAVIGTKQEVKQGNLF